MNVSISDIFTAQRLNIICNFHLFIRVTEKIIVTNTGMDKKLKDHTENMDDQLSGNGKKISSEMFIAIFAVIISLSTLFVYIYQSNLMKQ